MAFSPNGHVFAASDQTGAWLWDITDSGRIELVHRQTAVALDHGVRELAFSPSGRTLLSNGFDGTVRLWDMDMDMDMDMSRVVARICEVTGTALRREQRQEHVPGLPFEPPCPVIRRPPG